MKYLVFLFLYTQLVFAWEVSYKNETTKLVNKKFNISEEIIAYPRDKKVETNNLNKDLILIKYLENYGGTTGATKIYNCALFQKSSKKFIFKDLSCKHILINEKGKQEIEEANFKLTNNKIFYTFDELKNTFEIPQ